MCLRKDESGYAYMSIHLDGFMVIHTYPKMLIERISAVFLVKSHRPPVYYLGNDYQFHDDSNT